MVQEQDWGEAYKEIALLIKNDETPSLGVEEIKHVDLWHEQTNYLADEYPFPPNSVFIDFKGRGLETTGKKVQDINFDVTIYFVLDTLSQTYQGSDNQAISLDFIRICKKIHKKLQAAYGANFSELNRIDIGSEPAPEYLIVYKQVYTTIIRDASAMDEPGEATIKKVSTNKGTKSSSEGLGMYQIPE